MVAVAAEVARRGLSGWVFADAADLLAYLDRRSVSERAALDAHAAHVAAEAAAALHDRLREARENRLAEHRGRLERKLRAFQVLVSAPSSSSWDPLNHRICPCPGLPAPSL